MAASRPSTERLGVADSGMGTPKEYCRPPFAGKGVRLVDAGIRRAVRVLWENGIETTQSCEGGDGHPVDEPTIWFGGHRGEGFRALGIAATFGLKVSELRRIWPILDGEPTGPEWVMTFARTPALRDNPSDDVLETWKRKR